MRKIAIFLCCLIIPFSLSAFDTRIFRVKIDGRSKPTVDNIFSTKGKGKYEFQPFEGTYVLLTADTNYVLVKVTPKNTGENTMANNLFSLPEVDLYQQYRLDFVRGLEFVVDNSTIFPVNKDWSKVEISSP